jgi:hypothetical protein
MGYRLGLPPKDLAKPQSERAAVQSRQSKQDKGRELQGQLVRR